ncbi:hypothetical protein GBA65_22120 (plasmid) [Rubrobacter marinus]|uniref:Uncharacterized protein n=1 Tax=Rubrobacter marinus TaxID=2653852 RepID=A0A6G8Q3T4_9ACTN|nr:hypothetical protein [Rubrobacter marinus]QIN81132.1 hypothetical protein GBA65_22120 [Rubrobacter marinus]
MEGTFGTTKRFVICRLGAENRRGRRRELVDETDLLSQAEALPALLAAEHAAREGTTLRAPEASFSYEALCARTGRIVARHDAAGAPAWVLQVLGAAGASGPAAA